MKTKFRETASWMRRGCALGLVLATTAMITAEPADKAELDALRAEVRQLEEQLQRLKQKLDAKEAAPAAAPAPTPAPAAATPAGAKVGVSDKGVTLTSADGANSIKLRGLVQMDSRLFFNDHGMTNNAFVLRRARLITEGTFARNYSYQLVSEFAGSSVSILDANFTVGLSPAAQLKFGKFKMPIGLERLQSDSWTFFNERSIVTNLTPDRDLGVQLSGDLAAGVVSYAAGIFGGVADAAATNNSDFDNEKDLAARVMVSPFKNASDPALKGWSFGVGASTGRQKTASGRTAGYKTDGQQTFFTYNSTVVAEGAVWRIAPQADYRHGPLGVMGEYILSTVNVRPSATGAKAEVSNKAWQIAGGYVLTGEDSSYNGVVPKTNFDWAAGTWGAVELVGRYSDLKIDNAAFPVFAAPGGSANEAQGTGVGVNWYLSKTVRFSFDYYLTKFELNALAPTPAAAPLLRQDENALITRFQLSF
jgi:phosphate-selective porin OprO/OprP